MVCKLVLYKVVMSYSCYKPLLLNQKEPKNYLLIQYKLGKVLVAPFRKASTNMEAKLYSPMLTGPKCLELEVLMFRKSVNSFSISVVSEKGTSKLVELNGPQGQQWVPLQHSIFLPETLNYKVSQKSSL